MLSMLGSGDSKVSNPDSSFAQLHAKIRDCQQCKKQLPLEPRPILQIHPEARLMIVGQAPGIRAHHSHQPFNDPSGDRLRAWLNVDHKTFYNESKIAIVPMGFCYPGSGDRGDLPPRLECAQLWRDSVTEHLKAVELTLLVGQYAINWYLKGRKYPSLTETVQRWKEFSPSFVPLPHPSPRNNMWLKKNPWFIQDVIKPLQIRLENLL